METIPHNTLRLIEGLAAQCLQTADLLQQLAHSLPPSSVCSSIAHPENNWRNILGIPRPNKYSEVRLHILERLRFDDEFKSFYFAHSRVELCMRLTDEFGWNVDEKSLGRNINRHH